MQARIKKKGIEVLFAECIHLSRGRVTFILVDNDFLADAYVEYY